MAAQHDPGGYSEAGGDEPRPQVTVRVEQRHGVRVLEVVGEVDLATGDRFCQHLVELVGEGAPVRLDVGQAFFDLMGFQALLRAVDQFPPRLRPLPIVHASAVFRRIAHVVDPARSRVAIEPGRSGQRPPRNGPRR